MPTEAEDMNPTAYEAEGSDQEFGEPRTAVIGVGGAGTKFVDYMHRQGHDFTTIAINTDEAGLEHINADKKVAIGKTITRGKGAGGHPEVGETAAEMAGDVLAEVMGGLDIAYLVVGLGGGTGTGAGPVVAQLAKDMGTVVITVALTPFSVEVSRLGTARKGLRKLRSISESLIVLSNDKLLRLAPGMSVFSAFETMNNVIGQLVTTTHKAFVDTIKATATMDVWDGNVEVEPMVQPTVELCPAEQSAPTEMVEHVMPGL